MNTVRFSCTSLQGTPKKGVLKADENGYYTLPVGGLNVMNSGGQWYEYDGAKALFEESSQFMRRIKRGALRGENGHPKPQPNWSEDEYAMRILTIDESNVCAHFSEIYLDFDSFKSDDGNKIIAIMAKVTPSGKLSHILEKALNNPKENVCFSIRAFTADSYVRNRYHRVLKNIVTFDYVNEPGIAIAEKFKSPAMESTMDKIFNKNQLDRVLTNSANGIAKENFLLTPNELFSSLGWSLGGDTSKNRFTKW